MAAKHAAEKDYDDIPGTYVFDADRSRQGYHLNMFCMSLMKAENRKAFKENEAKYLDDSFPLTPEQREAILKRQYNRMLELGGNIYFTAKLGATDGHPFQHLAAVMTGSTQQDYADMMLRGGRSVEGNRSRSGKYAKPASSIVKADKPKPKAAARERNAVARIIAGVTSSHVPAIGAAIDNHRTDEPYWQRVFEGFERSKEWMAQDQAGRLHRRLQRPRLGVLGRDDPDLRARHRDRIPDRRRGLGPASGAGGEGPSRARLAHRAVGDPRRVRSHALQQDGGRPRPHRAAQPDVRLAEGMAVPGHSARGQRRACIRRRPATAASISARRSARRWSPIPRTSRS